MANTNKILKHIIPNGITETPNTCIV